MIKRKEDLAGCFVDGSVDELRVAFIAKCRELGVVLRGNTHLRYLYVGDDNVQRCITYTDHKMNKQLTIDDLKPIPQQESKMNIDKLATQVEEAGWKNGDECEIDMAEGVRRYIFGCECPNNQNTCIVFTKDGSGHMVMPIERLNKPESPEEKEKRERLEAAYDLYVDCGGYSDPLSFNQFCKPGTVSSQYLAIVDKTGYRLND